MGWSPIAMAPASALERLAGTTKGPPPPLGGSGPFGAVLRSLGLGGRAFLVAVGAREGDRRGVGDGDRLRLTAEGELLRRALGVVDVHHDDLTSGQLAVEDLLRQRVLDLALDGPAQRPGTQHRVEPAGGEQLLRRRRDLERHVLVRQLTLDAG